MDINEFKTEWCLLQNQFDSYEKHSLYIKLLNILLFFVALTLDVISISIVPVFLLLWLQDGIWKTFQSRIETRLLQVEKYIANSSEESVFQFNSEYDKTSLTGVSLLGEYARQSIRPTVAFPHVVIVLLSLAQWGIYAS